MTISEDAPSWTVRVEPLGAVVTVRATQSLLAAARGAQLSWPAPCGGVGVCTRCVVRVLDGATHLVPAGAYEVERLLACGARAGERLACHLKVCGPVTVEKVGVRRR